jgi:DNA-binding transcriptional LysR family regulator
MADDAPKPLNFSDVMLRHLKFKQLLVFDRVLQRRSILHASRELHLTQSAVTKGVRELEDDLGVQLFERSNRGVNPTAYGLLLGARVKSVIAEVRHLADELNAFRSAETGHVIVGTLIAGSARLLPMAIAQLKRQAPDVLITVREGVGDRLYPALATGELDIVVGRLPDREHPITKDFPLEHERLFTETFSLVVRSGHPLTEIAPLALADTLRWPWILPVPESPSRLLADRLFADAGLPLPSNRVDSLSLLTNVGLLIHGDACALVPHGALELFAAGGQLQELSIPGVGEFGEVGFSVRAGKPLTPAASLFVAALRTVAQCLPG